MCRAVTCKKCQKTTWAGCGEHVDQVMRDVPRTQQCQCDRRSTPAEGSGGFFSRLFGR